MSGPKQRCGEGTQLLDRKWDPVVGDAGDCNADFVLTVGGEPVMVVEVLGYGLSASLNRDFARRVGARESVAADPLQRRMQQQAYWPGAGAEAGAARAG